METQLNEIKRMQQLAGLLKENSNFDDDFDVDQDWSELEFLGTEEDHQGIWLMFVDPEDEYAEEEGYSFAIPKSQIEKVLNGDQNGVNDGSNMYHSMSKEVAQQLLSQI
jgi:hypothetical protein